MITVNIGRTFLKAYNQKYEKELSAKEFFEQEYFELFFNHPKYLQWPGNSEFVQGVKTLFNGKIGKEIKGNDGKALKFDSEEKANSFISSYSIQKNEQLEIRKQKNKKEYLILKTLDANQKKELLYNFYSKVERQLLKQDIDYSFVIGYPASSVDEFATTSGLITDITSEIDENEVYFSWIGSGLSIGVAGGLSILFEVPEILLKIYEGWKVYRRFLNNPTLDKLAGNKITSWNGQWLNYSFSKDYREDFDYASLDNNGFFKLDKTAVVIQTVKWSKLFFNLSSEFPEQTHTGYVFSLGQTNKTLGFYPFVFKQARKLVAFYKKLFGENAALKDASYYENMYGIHIKRACEYGAIGMQALEPDKLRQYFAPDKMPNLKKSSVSRKKDETDEQFEISVKEAEQKDYENKIIPFRIYKTWLLAMITKNKEEMSDYTQEIAKAIYEYRTAIQKEKAGSTKAGNTINSLLSSKSKKMFIEVLTEIVSDKNTDENKLEVLRELRNRVHLMNNEDFGYFVVLLKFDYAYQERIS